MEKAQEEKTDGKSQFPKQRGQQPSPHYHTLQDVRNQTAVKIPPKIVYPLIFGLLLQFLTVMNRSFYRALCGFMAVALYRDLDLILLLLVIFWRIQRVLSLLQLIIDWDRWDF